MSRSRSARRRLLPLLPAAMLVAVACGVPSSFDNITGGLREPDGGDGGPGPLVEDPVLAPPRPIAPISVSWLNTLRPRFRWERGEVDGARLELCRDRACTGVTKRFDVVGTELELTEDLEPGVWFWRLFSETTASIGKTASPTWELFVRPPAGKASTIPGGAILDFNGDGAPDLALIAEFEYEDQGVLQKAYEITPYLGKRDAPSTFTSAIAPEDFGFEIFASRSEIAAIDTNGDGFSDLIFSDVLPGPTQEAFLMSLPGSATGAISRTQQPILTPPLRGLPTLRETGDLDGDGWGDIVASTTSSLVILYGTARGLGVSAPIFDVGPFDGGSDAGFPSAPVAFTSGFGTSANDAGLSSFAFSDYPVDIVLGRDHRTVEHAYVETADPSMTMAGALVSGDFDGDGETEIAFTTLSLGKPKLCVVPAVGAFAVVPTCVPIAAAPEAVRLAACDLDGDGHDAILMTSGPGVDIVRRDGDALKIEPLQTAFGGQITVLSPGRPGPAIWAVTSPSGTSVGIFEGRREAAQIRPPDGAQRFARGLR